jgi:alkylation response protein AidB-like acyl-CoA dehydrogenase
MTDTAEVEKYRDEVRAWLANYAKYQPDVGLYAEGGVEKFRAWEERLIADGYAAMSWPTEYGGGGQPEWKEAIFSEEYVHLELPPRLNRMGLRLAGPTFLELANERQKKEWIPSIVSNTEIWCQGFSESDAGSDLASVQTVGRIDGDSLVITGSKIWTTLGAIATKMFALVKTDPTGLRHHNLTFVIIDLANERVTSNPLVQLHGDKGFSEFHFDEVVVPIDNVVGEIGEGWSVAMRLLNFERGRDAGREASLWRALAELSTTTADYADVPDVERVGELAAWAYAYQRGSESLVVTMEAGLPLGVTPNVLKLIWSESLVQIYEEVWRVRGEDGGVLETADAFGPWVGWQREYWHARASKIFAGTNQIQLNIIAETGLGLPRESASRETKHA